MNESREVVGNINMEHGGVHALEEIEQNVIAIAHSNLGKGRFRVSLWLLSIAQK